MFAPRLLWLLGQILTQLADDVAGGARSSDELDALRHEVEHLRRALSSRAQIDQAKGVLMLRYGISADRAFEVLVRWSQQANVKLRVLAGALLQVAQGADPLTPEDTGVDLRWLAAQLRADAVRPDPARRTQGRKVEGGSA